MLIIEVEGSPAEQDDLLGRLSAICNRHDPIREIARGGVLEDQLVTAIGEDLALDDDLAFVGLGGRGDARGRAAAPLQLDRLPGVRLR